jgi:hypothetical protein
MAVARTFVIIRPFFFFISTLLSERVASENRRKFGHCDLEKLVPDPASVRAGMGRAASALSALVVQTAVSSTSELACTAGRWE